MHHVDVHEKQSQTFRMILDLHPLQDVIEGLIEAFNLTINEVIEYLIDILNIYVNSSTYPDPDKEAEERSYIFTHDYYIQSVANFETHYSEEVMRTTLNQISQGIRSIVDTHKIYSDKTVVVAFASMDDHYLFNLMICPIS